MFKEILRNYSFPWDRNSQCLHRLMIKKSAGKKGENMIFGGGTVFDIKNIQVWESYIFENSLNEGVSAVRSRHFSCIRVLGLCWWSQPSDQRSTCKGLLEWAQRLSILDKCSAGSQGWAAMNYSSLWNSRGSFLPCAASSGDLWTRRVRVVWLMLLKLESRGIQYYTHLYYVTLIWRSVKISDF